MNRERTQLEHLWRIIDAGVPAQATAVFAYLMRLEATGAGPSTVAEIAQHYAVSRQAAANWVRDLLALSVVERERIGHAFAYRPNCQKTLQKLKRRDDGRVQRCATCRSPNPRGRWCARCKQTHGRTDRAWWPHAEKLLRQGMKPHAVHAALSRRTPPVIAPVWDYVPEGQQQTAPGIVSRGLMLGLLDDEWARRQKEYFAGVDGEDC